MSNQTSNRFHAQPDRHGSDQRWIERTVLASSPFDWDALSECPLFRGELGEMFRSTHAAWASRKISEALSLFLFVLDHEEAQALFLHLQGRTDHEIGDAIKRDPKTAKTRWMAAEQKVGASSPRGEPESIESNEKSRP